MSRCISFSDWTSADDMCSMGTRRGLTQRTGTSPGPLETLPLGGSTPLLSVPTPRSRLDSVSSLRSLWSDSIVEMRECTTDAPVQYLIINLGLSQSFSVIDWGNLVFPAKMTIDYIRVSLPLRLSVDEADEACRCTNERTRRISDVILQRCPRPITSLGMSQRLRTPSLYSHNCSIAISTRT